MTAKNTTGPDDDDSLGVLDDAASLDTAVIGILSGTAQVNVAIPTGDEDDLFEDDDVVDGEVAAEVILESAPQLEPVALDEVGRIKDGGIDIVIELPAEELPAVAEPAVTAEVILDTAELAAGSAAPDAVAAADIVIELDDADVVEDAEATPAEQQRNIDEAADEAAPSAQPVSSGRSADAVATADATVPAEATEPAEADAVTASMTKPAKAKAAKAKPAAKSASKSASKSAAAGKSPSTAGSATVGSAPDAPVVAESAIVGHAADRAVEPDAVKHGEPAASTPETAASTSDTAPAPSSRSGAAQAASVEPTARPAVASDSEGTANAPVVVRARSSWADTVERAAAGEASDPAEAEDENVSTEQERPAVTAPRTAATPTRTEVELTSKRLGDQLGQASRESADLLTADRLLDPHQITKPEPEGAWPHFLYSVSGRRINIGDGKKAKARKALSAKIAAPLSGGARFVPVLSRKGGVGKTTITALLGMALADARDDRVIAVDANPDRGTLAERIVRSHTKSVRDLVRIHDEVRGYHDISAIVARDTTRLDVLASDSDPRIADAFGDADYRDVADVAAHYYSLVLTDTGTGIVHSVMGATLELADQLVIVSGLSVDEARLASETLTWLETNGYAAQARDAIVVLNQSTPGSPLVRLNELEAHFATRARHVVRMPYDAQIAGGGPIVFTSLQPETRQAARELAAILVEGLRASAV